MPVCAVRSFDDCQLMPVCAVRSFDDCPLMPVCVVRSFEDRYVVPLVPSAVLKIVLWCRLDRPQF